MTEEKEPPSSPTQAAGAQAQRVAVGFALLLIAVLGGVYWMYFRRQRDFYTARDLRVVRTMTVALDERIAVNSGYVKNAVRYGDKSSIIDITENCGREDVPADKKALPAKLAAMPGREWFARTLIVSGKETFLRLAYYTLIGPPAVQNVRRGCSDVDLNALLQPAFNLDLGRAFDEILVADSSGHVLYHVHPPRSTSSLLFESAPGKNDASGSPLEIEDLGALLESKGWRDAKPLELAPLLRATRTTNVVLSDAGYILFSQPYIPGTTGPNQRWIVCGLVSAPHFRNDIARVPAPLAMLATALAILAICAWPFLRVALMNELEPIMISDAVLIAICTIIAAAILTLAFLDTFAYMHLTSVARTQLGEYGDKLASDYDNNVTRAAAALDSIRWRTKDVAHWSDASIAKRLEDPDPRDPVDFEGVKVDPLKNYPYFRSFAWVDNGGVERFKYAPTSDSPRVDVSGRQYFIDAIHNDLWLTTGRPGPSGGNLQRIPFAIEWVRSASTGRVTTAIAERTGSPFFPVIVLATDLIDVAASVPPPDVRFAVIDEQGNVLYHSDQQRIGYENFFAEADESPALRSAVLGRRAAFVEANYWGDDTEMYVRPLPNSAWTLVVFRAKKLVRVLNEEAVLLTLVPLILGALPYLLMYAAILIIAPRYRAPALWPDPHRRGDYVRLARLYVFLAIAFAAAIYLFDPAWLPPIVFLFPAQAIVSTYILLHRDDRRPRVGLALAGWIVLTVLLGAAIYRAERDARVLAARLFSRPWIPNAIVLTLLAIAALASLSFFMPASEGGAKRSAFRMSYSAAYRLCGTLLLVLAAALPVVGYFKIATHISVELYTKYAQLRVATNLESRLNELASMNGLGAWRADDVRGDVLKYDTTHVFNNRWCLVPALPGSGGRCDLCAKATRATIPPFFPDMLPTLSSDFMATRMLQEAESRDNLWRWCSAKDGSLRLDRRIRLQPANAVALYGTTIGVESAPEQQHLVLTSDVPLLRDMHPQRLAHIAALVGLSVVAFVLFWIVVDFIARRLLLIDLAGPLWLSRVPLSPSLGDHIFLMRRDKSADELTGSKSFYDVSFKTMDEDDSWDDTLAEIDRSVAGRNVRITDFEYGIDDGEKNCKKLQWIERLLALPDRTVIVVSAVSAGYVCTAPATAPPPIRPPDPALAPPPAAPVPAVDPAARWKKILSSFVWVTQEQLDLPEAPPSKPEQPAVSSPSPAKPLDPAGRIASVRRTLSVWLAAVWKWLTNRLAFHHARRDWIRSETEHDRYLARLAEEIEPLRGQVPVGEEHQLFLDEIGERAGTYYAGLWASCSIGERVLLYQLARNGLLNGKDRRLVRRLLARRFIRRAPHLEIFSETFRRYILAAARRDNLKSVAATLRPSRWRDLRAALAVLAVAFILMLFATQQDLFKTATGLATSITASVPLLIKLLGLLGDRRTDAAARG